MRRPSLVAALSLFSAFAPVVTPTAAPAQDSVAPVHQSAYGCRGLENGRDLPAIEGKDGVFFRINADLRMNHPFSDEVVAQLGELSQALASRGTTLIYAPIPSKSVAMPDQLPAKARLYGFNLDVATAVHDDVRDRLRAAGVITVDVRAALRASDPGAPPFFGSDFHWNAHGANLAAQAIADVVKTHPDYGPLDKTLYQSVETGKEIAFSGMRRILQVQCTETLPEPVTMTYDTSPVEVDLGLGGDDSGGLDLFGEEQTVLPVVLVGTSFSDSPINNFPGFIAEHAQLEVVNYAITGGNQFGAITSYLTSEDFQDNPPRFLIWENPIYNNLAQAGDQPLRELIAAAWDSCAQRVPFTMAEDRRSLIAKLDPDLSPLDTLFLDSDGSAALEIDFRFQSGSGRQRQKTIRRGERLRRTGRFYMPLSGLWPEGATEVEIALTAPLGSQAELTVCRSFNSEEKS